MPEINFHDLIGSQQIGTLAIQYDPGDPTITLALPLPAHIVAKGPDLDFKIEGQLFKGTAFDVTDQIIDVTPDPQTADATHVVGTPVYLVTASSTLEALRDRPIEEALATSTDTTKVFAPDGAGGIQARDESGVSAFEDLTTTETDTTLVASPNGTGGVQWRAETGGGGGGSGGGNGVLGVSSTRANTTIPQNGNTVAYQVTVSVQDGETVHIDALVSVVPTTFSMVTDIGAWLQRDATVISPKHSTSSDQYRATYSLGWSDTPGAGSYTYKVYVEETANRDSLDVLDNGYVQVVSVGGGSGGPLNNIDAHLTTDFTLTNDATWYNVLSVSLPAGTYKAQAVALVQSTSGSPWAAARIWDGTTVYGSANASLPNVNNVLSLPVITEEFTLGATTTLYLSCAAHGASSKVAASTFDPDAQPKATILSVQEQIGGRDWGLQEAVPSANVTTSGSMAWSLVCSLSLGAGQWEVEADTLVASSNSPCTFSIALSDGSAYDYIVTHHTFRATAGDTVPLHIGKKITLAGTTTVGLYIMSDNGTITAYKEQTAAGYRGPADVATTPITVLHARPAA